MKDRYTLITGASNGIGKAIADCCARRHMNLVLVALPRENLEELSYSLAVEHCVKVLFLELDLTEPHATDEVFSWCTKMDVEINILINNAGIGYQGNFSDFDSSFYKNLIALNVMALTTLTRHFLPELKRHEKAYILNVSSIGGFYPMPFKTVYAASKSYVTAFSEALHEELKNTSVSVSTLCPAGVDSFNDSTRRIEKIGWIAKLGRLKPCQVAEAALDGMLVGRRRIIPGAINVFFHYLTRTFPTRTKAWLVHLVLMKFHPSVENQSSQTEKKHIVK